MKYYYIKSPDILYLNDYIDFRFEVYVYKPGDSDQLLLAAIKYNL